ncbi:uncharacterized protein LOC121411727 [Lytechinus variegatus]|uniref:uncharacterized protein LOC121411727 n=1 Tax=Lytechinus variegatus TaxID=7654 RepID=UPI001BB22D98|nr:uncharacterized protein LOC121411727 [Lytechinus variegatus]
MEMSSSPTWLKQPAEGSKENVCQASHRDIIMFSEVSRPVTLSMKLLGLWHERSPPGVAVHPAQQEEDAQSLQRNQSFIHNILNRLGFVYHAFVVLVMWFDLVRFLVFIAPTLNLQNASYLCWYVQNATTNTVLFLACYRTCKIQRFFSYWQNPSAERHRVDFDHRSVDTQSPKPRCMLQRKKFKKVGILAALGGWFFVLGSYPVSMYFTFGYHGEEFRIMCSPWTSDIPCGFLQVISFFALACHKFPVVYLCLICYVLSERFDSLTKAFKEENPLGTCARADVLEETRRQHNILCFLTSQCDYIFSTLVAIVFATDIPLLIFLMYDIYFNSDSSSTFTTALSAYWGISNMLNILLISWFCSMLNEKAHSLRRHVYELHVDASDTRTSHIHLLLVSRLNGPNIGLSFIGFFTITRNVILTIAGFVLTYFTLLIDLGPEKSHDLCNNATSNLTS